MRLTLSSLKNGGNTLAIKYRLYWMRADVGSDDTHVLKMIISPLFIPISMYNDFQYTWDKCRSLLDILSQYRYISIMNERTSRIFLYSTWRHSLLVSASRLSASVIKIYISFQLSQWGDSISYLVSPIRDLASFILYLNCSAYF